MFVQYRKYSEFHPKLIVTYLNMVLKNYSYFK